MIKREDLTEIEVFDKQPLVLAMVGDAVYTLYVRTRIASKTDLKVNDINKRVSAIVNAGAQAKTFRELEENLTEREKQVARRARNTHIHSHAKNFSIEEYIHATALEALIGYLYLSGQDERLNEILNKVEII